MHSAPPGFMYRPASNGQTENDKASRLMNDSSRAPGQVVGQYILDSLLGVGGMAEVWLARHRSLETPVAIKFLNSRYAGHLEVEARFLEEGKLQARLTTLNTRSANILPVLDYLV